jgi:hypothetical protein
LKDLEKKIKGLEKVIPILEDHLERFGHLMSSKAFNFISEMISYYKQKIEDEKDLYKQEEF